MAYALQGTEVPRHPEVRIVPLQEAVQVQGLLSNRQVPHQVAERRQGAADPGLLSPNPHFVSPAPIPGAVQGEADEVDRLRSSSPSFRCVPCGEPAELDQFRFVRFQRQIELRQPLAQDTPMV